MPLNLSVNEGDFTPYIKYNAKAGRFYVKPEGATEEVEVVNPLLAFDMAHIKTGWLFYQEGAGPEKVWDPSPSQAAPRPVGPQKWKRGFEVMVYGNAVVGGKKIGLREFSSTAGNVITAILRMHGQYEAGLRENRGKIPVFGCEGVKPISGMYGTNYEPQFILKTWIERTKIPDFDSHATSSHANNGGAPEPPPIESMDDFASRGGPTADDLADFR